MARPGDLPAHMVQATGPCKGCHQHGGSIMMDTYIAAAAVTGATSDECVTQVMSRALANGRAFGQVRCMSNALAIEPEQKAAKTRTVSRRVRHAIDLMISGQAKTQKAAAEKAGLTRERFCRALKERHVIEYLDDQTRVLLAQSRAPAAATLMTLLEQAKSEHVRKDVATTLLGINGIHATGDRGPIVSIGIAGAAGYVIDLRGPGEQSAHIEEIGPAGGVVLDRGKMIDVTPTDHGSSAPSAPARGYAK